MEDNKTHFFGEMDLDLSKGIKELEEDALKIGEQCSYMAEIKDSKTLSIWGLFEPQQVTIAFDDNNKVDSVTIYEKKINGEIEKATTIKTPIPKDLEVAL